MNQSPRLRLFEGYGVELEYMIVHRGALDAAPIADRVLRALGGGPDYDVEVNGASWSNELVLHVIELKNTRPAAALESLPALFQARIEQINEVLQSFDAQLMPSGMHPWMDPRRETRLWPHEYREVYQSYHRIFDCYRHGWANLQSVHLNLPFADEEEFARLHAAVRVLTPILPAIAASSPICCGRPTGLLDTRMEAYRKNAERVPSLTGQVIPEPVFGIQQYQEQILRRMYADIAPLDSEGVLQHEFLNARGAIARFDRGAIEIRVLDVQECPAADVAICAVVSYVLKELVAETWADVGRQRAWGVEPLQEIFLKCIVDAEQAVISQREYLDMFGYRGDVPATAGQLWRWLVESARAKEPDFARLWGRQLALILDAGPLARRILKSVGDDPAKERIEQTYRSLCVCLGTGRMFAESAPQASG